MIKKRLLTIIKKTRRGKCLKLSQLFFNPNGNKRERYLTVQFSCLLTFQRRLLFLVTLYFQKSFVACQIECHPARFQTHLFFPHFLFLFFSSSFFFFNQALSAPKAQGAFHDRLFWALQGKWTRMYVRLEKAVKKSLFFKWQWIESIACNNGWWLICISLLPVSGRRPSTVHELEQTAWHLTGVATNWQWNICSSLPLTHDTWHMYTCPVTCRAAMFKCNVMYI